MMLSAFWWKKTVRTRPRSGRRVSLAIGRTSTATISGPAVSEKLEDRTLLTVNALFFSGELDIFATANDSITVRTDPANFSFVQVLGNGVPVSSVGSLLASQISRLVIDAGSGDNVVNLSGVSSAFFPALTGVTVDGGDGDDTVDGGDGTATGLAAQLLQHTASPALHAVGL